MTVTKMDVVETGKIWAFGYPPSPSIPKLEPGLYKTWITPFQRGFEMVEVKSDKLIQMKKSVSSQVVADIDLFLKDEVKQNFKDYNFLYRRGVLLYGPPGTGKTSSVMEIARKFIKEKNGVVLINPAIDAVAPLVNEYRECDPGRTFLVVFEELESLIDDGYEDDLLNLLDGVNSIDNVIWLATTNYIKEIPERLKHRPSRFARIIKVGSPNADVRRAFLEQVILERHKKEANIDSLVKETDGFTIDQLKDLVVTMFCLNLTQKQAIDSLRKMMVADDDNE
jgi:SpoVK/Ycf46/Vps4 family AAA+-type ATPase